MEAAARIPSQAARIFGSLYETLLVLNPATLEYEPAIAEKWSISEDKKTFTFYIDKAARWSDGNAITAQDVKWTYDAIMDPNNLTGVHKLAMERFFPPVVVDKYTVRFTYGFIYNLMTFAIDRKKTRQIMVGNIKIGGMAPVSVQSMTNTFTQDVAATVSQIKRLEIAGCEIVRVAVPDKEAATAIAHIKQQVSIPLIADIHFDYRLALASAQAGADGLRLNPGNIGGAKKVKAIVDCAKEYQIPIRIGVNSGSLEKDILKKYKGVSPEAMVESAIRQIESLQSHDFHAIKVSLKASDVHRTVEAYRLLSARTDLPLHVGVTRVEGHRLEHPAAAADHA